MYIVKNLNYAQRPTTLIRTNSISLRQLIARTYVIPKGANATEWIVDVNTNYTTILPPKPISVESKSILEEIHGKFQIKQNNFFLKVSEIPSRCL